MELAIGAVIAFLIVLSAAEDETLEEYARREARKHGKGQRTAVHHR